MKQRIGRILMLGACGCGIALMSAQAGDGPKKPFRHVDKDKDGVIEPAEIRKEKKEHDSRAVADKKWEKKADANQDGKVDFKEICVYRRQVMDTDGNGKVSVEERQTFWISRKAVVNTPAERRFDANHDGVITGDEAKALMESLIIVVKTDGKAKVNTAIEKEFDANQDGVIDAAEAEGVKEALGLSEGQ